MTQRVKPGMKVAGKGESVMLAARIKSDTVRRLKQEAAANYRSMAAELVHILDKHFEKLDREKGR